MRCGDCRYYEKGVCRYFMMKGIEPKEEACMVFVERS